MFTKERALQLIQEGVDSLVRGGVIENHIQVDATTILLGAGSTLDSLGFVSLVTELEDRMTAECSRDIFFVLDDVQDFNVDNPFLAAEVFISYMMRLASEEVSS